MPSSVDKKRKSDALESMQSMRKSIDPQLFKDYKVQTDVDRKLLLGVWEDLQNNRIEEDKDS